MIGGKDVPTQAECAAIERICAMENKPSAIYSDPGQTPDIVLLRFTKVIDDQGRAPRMLLQLPFKDRPKGTKFC
ncbi:MAG: hypothetical protein JWQ49_4379 [Edaphobacter sp.]|nr:hypothetical protein [Edaphobacter sp.]